jgi:hypothetical protein
MFLIVPFFSVFLVVFYCGALCKYFGYRLDSRAPLGRMTPAAIALAAVALPVAYKLSHWFWDYPDLIKHVMQHGFD